MCLCVSDVNCQCLRVAEWMLLFPDHHAPRGSTSNFELSETADQADLSTNSASFLRASVPLTFGYSVIGKLSENECRLLHTNIRNRRAAELEHTYVVHTLTRLRLCETPPFLIGTVRNERLSSYPSVSYDIASNMACRLMQYPRIRAPHAFFPRTSLSPSYKSSVVYRSRLRLASGRRRPYILDRPQGPRYDRFRRSRGIYELWNTSPVFRQCVWAGGLSLGLIGYSARDTVPITGRGRFNIISSDLEI